MPLSPDHANPAACALTDADVAHARQRFFEHGELPSAPLHQRILASWQRCVAAGLSADRRPCLMPLEASALRQARARNEALCLLAETELEFLRETLSDTGSQIILADATGLILDTCGSPGALDRATREALLPGMNWAENVMGTNAIGTALTDGQLVEVWGAEHFHLQQRHICCTASPILDHTGTIVGLLDVSGDARLPRGYARNLVSRSVREIERHWLLKAPARFARLHVHPSRGGLGSYREGIVLLDDECIVGANRTALRWLGGDWSLIGRKLADLCELRDVGQHLFQLRGRNGTLLHGSLQRPAHPARNARQPETNEPSSPRTTDKLFADTSAGLANPTGEALDHWLSQAHQTHLQRARRAINAGLSVVLSGETGSGKEVFARLAHAGSARASGPFVAINCAALPEGLIEAELFGYVDGAFTGARRKGARGRILEAHGGTLFLDEIGDMPLALQARLLRVLQDREVVPLGGGASHRVDCVVISATHRSLENLVEQGLFRQDLFFRLQDHRVQLPALRELPLHERQAALQWLWACSNAARRAIHLSDAALRRLVQHHWPGNLRQAASVVRTLVALADDGQTLGCGDLPADIAEPSSPGCTTPVPLEIIGERAIQEALARHGGKVAAAARELGIHRATLYRRLKTAQPR